MKVKQLDEHFLPWLSGVMQIVHEHGENPLAKSAASVNCDGCDLCCCNSNTLVTREEALNPVLKAEWLDHSVPIQDSVWIIPKDELRRCIHLTETGCAIFDDRPSTCRVFDCRKRIVANMADIFTLKMAEQWDMSNWYTEENRLIISAIRNAALSYHKAKPSANISEITFYAIMNWGEFVGPVWQAMEAQR